MLLELSSAMVGVQVGVTVYVVPSFAMNEIGPAGGANAWESPQ